MNLNGVTGQQQQHHEDLSIHVHVDRRGAGLRAHRLARHRDVADRARRADQRLGTRQSSLIVDLTKVDFLDSTGLGALIGGQRRAREFDGEVRLVAKEGQILSLLRITGLLKVFSVYPTLDEALKDGQRVGDL